ncbi:MAG: hypothetical protein IT195_00385 [Microthrixaceae bacterium]|nr:hypothetical protein [Microthrixaceae bacterium]
MTEVPEHLLQRSRARRAALGLGGDAGEASATAPVAAAPEAAAAAAPAAAAPAAAVATAPAAPPPPTPVAPNVQAALSRKKIPFWVIPVLAALPIWALMYALTLDKPAGTAAGPLAEGPTVYGSCSGCHGPAGAGVGAFPKLSDGAVVKGFATVADQLYWVMEGTDGFKAAGIATYGTSNKAVGGAGNMPGWKSLTAEELISVVRYERETLSGEEMDEAKLQEAYDGVLAMVNEKFPARAAEFEAAIAGWAGLPPDA